MMERSAEFCRGALWGMERYRNDREKGFLEIRGEFRVRLAEAEAREGSVLGDWFDWPPPPNVSEVLAWREDSGVFPAKCAWCTKATGSGIGLRMGAANRCTATCRRSGGRTQRHLGKPARPRLRR